MAVDTTGETAGMTRRAFRAGAALLTIAAFGLGACGGAEASRGGLNPNETPELRALIDEYADANGVPRDLVQRVVVRESAHLPGARNGPYYGLMQILPETAWRMGYRGDPSGLLDAETNLKYAVRYLRGAWLVADGDRDEAVEWYSRGYYYEARRKGLLEETGLR
jgi:soluble lytic murein transglycosylase-like protein